MQSIERMKDGLPVDFLELPQEGSLWAAIRTIDQHLLTGFSRKIRVDENDFALAEGRLHGIVFHLDGKRPYP